MAQSYAASKTSVCCTTTPASFDDQRPSEAGIITSKAYFSAGTEHTNSLRSFLPRRAHRPQRSGQRRCHRDPFPEWSQRLTAFHSYREPADRLQPADGGIVLPRGTSVQLGPARAPSAHSTSHRRRRRDYSNRGSISASQNFSSDSLSGTPSPTQHQPPPAELL